MEKLNPALALRARGLRRAYIISLTVLFLLGYYRRPVPPTSLPPTLVVTTNVASNEREREGGREGERIGGEGKGWLVERRGSRGDHDTESEGVELRAILTGFYIN